MAYIDPTTGGLKFLDKKDALDKLADKKDDINAHYNPQKSKLSLEQRLKLCLEVGEECIAQNELEELLKRKDHPVCYDGFEPSGRMHIAQGILKVINVNKLVDAGCVFVFWVADWFALLNNKMGGDLEKIKIVGKYFIEIWKAAGMKLHNVKFLWASEEINSKANDYWLQVMDIARRNTLARIRKCATIMGRNEDGEFAVAQMLYPCMQCTDVFFLKADICQLGMDQRKVNMLAREYCDDIKKKDKPVILSHHMLGGLKEGQLKMSKSDPMSAIFMEDEESAVIEKINLAYCPPKIIQDNPCLEYVKYIIFGWFGSLTIKRPEKWGGDVTYNKYEDLEKDYAEEKLHPGDLKPAIAAALNKILQPIRDHFKNDPQAREILNLVRSFRVNKATEKTEASEDVKVEN